MLITLHTCFIICFLENGNSMLKLLMLLEYVSNKSYRVAGAEF